MDYAEERLKQILELFQWCNNNIDFQKITPNDAIKLFDGDKENLDKDLEHLYKIYFEIVEYAKLKFKIGKFTAMEFTNTVLLKKIESHDIQNIRDEIKKDSIQLINPSFTKTEKVTRVVKIISSSILNAIKIK